MNELYDKVEVELWVVLYAVRYGMGRMTYANVESSNLAQKFWDKFPDNIQKQIFEDTSQLTGLEAKPWLWLTETVVPEELL